MRAIEPHTEADPAALVIQSLVAFGNVIGRGAHFMADGAAHHMNLFCVLVGGTAKSRKGSSWAQVRRLFETVDPEWARDRTQAGLSSGEGLIHFVRDAIEKQEPVREKGRVKDYQTVVEDPGVKDKRLLVVEAEFASALRVIERDGNTLSPIVREAWDRGDLRVMTKTSPARATGAHISIIGHITSEELLRYFGETEQGNGFGNRFLWLCARRSKALPEGGHIHTVDFAPLVRRLTQAEDFARGVGEMQRDEWARQLWHEIYEDLSEGQPGLLGAMIARAEAQVMRLACIYALLDLSAMVRREHLEAALEVWRYCEASARFVFGDALGDPMADELRKVLRDAPEGMTRTDLMQYFKRNRSAREIGRGLGVLAKCGLARFEKEAAGPGRPAERWFATRAGNGSASTN